MRPQLGVIIGIVVAGQALAQRQLLQGYEPPGKLVEACRRNIHCYGNGSPTIILRAGGGAFSIDWTLVQPRVAEKTRVCSYDRAGLAWSDPGPSDETVEQTIGDIHALLMAAGGKEPYLLVGASVGGVFIRVICTLILLQPRDRSSS
jgi:pimeloyl-ACP methyl ester carboxylesterase